MTLPIKEHARQNTAAESQTVQQTSATRLALDLELRASGQASPLLIDSSQKPKSNPLNSLTKKIDIANCQEHELNSDPELPGVDNTLSRAIMEVAASVEALGERLSLGRNSVRSFDRSLSDRLTVVSQYQSQSSATYPPLPSKPSKDSLSLLDNLLSAQLDQSEMYPKYQSSHSEDYYREEPPHQSRKPSVYYSALTSPHQISQTNQGDNSPQDQISPDIPSLDLQNDSSAFPYPMADYTFSADVSTLLRHSLDEENRVALERLESQISLLSHLPSFQTRAFLMKNSSPIIQDSTLPAQHIQMRNPSVSQQNDTTSTILDEDEEKSLYATSQPALDSFVSEEDVRDTQSDLLSYYRATPSLVNPPAEILPLPLEKNASNVISDSETGYYHYLEHGDRNLTEELGSLVDKNTIIPPAPRHPARHQTQHDQIYKRYLSISTIPEEDSSKAVVEALHNLSEKVSKLESEKQEASLVIQNLELELEKTKQAIQACEKSIPSNHPISGVPLRSFTTEHQNNIARDASMLSRLKMENIYLSTQVKAPILEERLRSQHRKLGSLEDSSEEQSFSQCQDEKQSYLRAPFSNLLHSQRETIVAKNSSIVSDQSRRTDKDLTEPSIRFAFDKNLPEDKKRATLSESPNSSVYLNNNDISSLVLEINESRKEIPKSIALQQLDKGKYSKTPKGAWNEYRAGNLALEKPFWTPLQPKPVMDWYTKRAARSVTSEILQSHFPQSNITKGVSSVNKTPHKSRRDTPPRKHNFPVLPSSLQAQKLSLPFVVGTNAGKSYSVPANLQAVHFLMKAHHPDFCRCCNGEKAGNHVSPHSGSLANRIHILDKLSGSMHTQLAASCRARTLAMDSGMQNLPLLIQEMEFEYAHYRKFYKKLISRLEELDIAGATSYSSAEYSSGDRSERKKLGVDLKEVISKMELKGEQLQTLRQVYQSSLKI